MVHSYFLLPALDSLSISKILQETGIKTIPMEMKCKKAKRLSGEALQIAVKRREVKSLSHVQFFATPWTVAHQAPPSMEFSRQEYWSGVPLPSLNCSPAAAAKSLQLCLTLCNPIGSSPPGSPVPGILQARTLEWVAISFSSA